MRYEFPHIEHVDQIRDAIKGMDEFFIAERPDEGVFVVNYHVNSTETFSTPHDPTLTVATPKKDSENDIRYRLRRECRGIKFDINTGKIVARPFQKFFNLGEKVEVFPENVDWNAPFIILDKLDGSMIHPIPQGNGIAWCTKMGVTEISGPAADFANSNPAYVDLAKKMIAEGKTPIFEWCTRKNRIIVDYPEDALILTAVRDNVTGEYMAYDDMKNLGVPVVKAWDGTYNGINEFVKYVSEMEYAEGFVIRFDDGHMLKLKSAWYVQLHKTKEMLTYEKDVWAIILDNNVDDIKAFMEPYERDRIDSFQTDLIAGLNNVADDLKWIVIAAKDNLNESKKKFALTEVPKHPEVYKALLFKIWDGYDPVELTYDYVRKNCNTQANLEKVRPLVNLRWEDY